MISIKSFFFLGWICLCANSMEKIESDKLVYAENSVDLKGNVHIESILGLLEAKVATLHLSQEETLEKAILEGNVHSFLGQGQEISCQKAIVDFVDLKAQFWASPTCSLLYKAVLPRSEIFSIKADYLQLFFARKPELFLEKLEAQEKVSLDYGVKAHLQGKTLLLEQEEALTVEQFTLDYADKDLWIEGKAWTHFLSTGDIEVEGPSRIEKNLLGSLKISGKLFGKEKRGEIVSLYSPELITFSPKEGHLLTSYAGARMEMDKEYIQLFPHTEKKIFYTTPSWMICARQADMDSGEKEVVFTKEVASVFQEKEQYLLIKADKLSYNLEKDRVIVEGSPVLLVDKNRHVQLAASTIHMWRTEKGELIFQGIGAVKIALAPEEEVVLEKACEELLQTMPKGE